MVATAGHSHLLDWVTAAVWPIKIEPVAGLWATHSDHSLIFATPIIGPSASLLLHRLAWTATSDWTSIDLAAQLGLQPAKAVLALDRIIQYGFIRIDPDHPNADGAVIVIPERLGPLAPRLCRMLPERVARLHEHLATSHNR